MPKVLPRRRIRLRVDKFEAWIEPLKLPTLADKARFTNTDPGHFHKVYYGKKGVGGIFADRVLSADWPQPKPPAFEDLFEFEEVA